jgi:hypothetical protein
LLNPSDSPVENQLPEPLRWFTEPVRTRAIWPGASLTVPQYILKEIEETRHMDLFRVAVVQTGSVPFDRERSTMKALDLTGQAIRSGARLIVFPEAFISGYPRGSISGHVLGCGLLKGGSGSAPISRVPSWYLDPRWTY